MPELTLEYRVTQLENRVKENELRNTTAHKEFYDKFEHSAITEAVNVERHAQIMTKLEILSNDVARINSIPASRWNDLIKSILVAIGGAIGGGIIMSIVMGMS